MAASVKYLIIWINIGSIVSAGYRHYVMNDALCGSVLYFDHEQIYGATFSMNLTNSSPSQGQCEVNVTRSTSSYSRLHFYVSEFINNRPGCSTYSLAVNIGDSDNTIIPHSVFPKVCDNSFNKVSATSRRTFLQFIFTWNATVPDFYTHIVVNAYSQNSCHDDDDETQTECDNGRCIPTDLKCKGYNPCGDNSDCEDPPSEMSNTVRILYTIGSLIIFIFIMAIIYNVCFKTKWSEQCKCEDRCCCSDLCACVCISLRDCFGACFSRIKKSGSKLKWCCSGLCCKNTVSTGGASGTSSQPAETEPCESEVGVALPPYSARTFSPPPSYSVAMRHDPPPVYSSVFNISVEPSRGPPPDYDMATDIEMAGTGRRV